MEKKEGLVPVVRVMLLPRKTREQLASKAWCARAASSRRDSAGSSARMGASHAAATDVVDDDDDGDGGDNDDDDDDELGVRPRSSAATTASETKASMISRRPSKASAASPAAASPAAEALAASAQALKSTSAWVAKQMSHT